MALTKEELTGIAIVRDDKGLVLKTANGFEGYIQRDNGDREAPVNDLIEECFNSFDKSERIAKLEAVIGEISDLVIICDQGSEDESVFIDRTEDFLSALKKARELVPDSD